MIINCKKHFSTNEIWYEFFDNKKNEIVEIFQRLLYFITETNFDFRWQTFQNKYNLINENICVYLSNEIILKKEQWCKIWTNQKMHFNNHIFFKNENDYAQLKIKLKLFFEDLMSIIKKSIVVAIELKKIISISWTMLNNVWITNSKNRYIEISWFILLHMLCDKLTNIIFDYLMFEKNVDLSSCTKIFRRIMNFFCVHEIENRFVDTADKIYWSWSTYIIIENITNFHVIISSLL